MDALARAPMFVEHIMQKTLNIEQYKKLLACNYLVHSLYEKEIFNKLTTEIALSIDVEKRTKLPSLILDLNDAKITCLPFLIISFMIGKKSPSPVTNKTVSKLL